MRNNHRHRAEIVFTTLGIDIVATRAGQFFKGAPIISGVCGIRWWLTSLPSKSIDRFGVQIMRHTAEPDLVHFVRHILRNNFFEKTSGNFNEFFREVDFLIGGAPDIDNIRTIYQEILSVLLEINSKKERPIPTIPSLPIQGWKAH